MSLEQVQAAMKAAHDQIELRNPDHLYIPGRTLILFEERGQAATTLASPRGGNKSGVWKYSVTDGSAAVLRLFECDSLRMVTDHATASYEIGVEQCFYN
jgi:hypothetical protein